MKKRVILSILFLCLFWTTGCEETTPKSNLSTPANLREITGKIEKATLDEKGNIIVKEEEITTDVTYISYEYENVTIGLLAVRDSKGIVHVVVNTCGSCGGSPYAYFVQVGNKIQCQNCGSLFAIDELNNLVENGCNPLQIEKMTKKDGIITIGTEQLNNLKEQFLNWQGPKA